MCFFLECKSKRPLERKTNYSTAVGAENTKHCLGFQWPGDPGQTKHVCQNENLHRKKTSYPKKVVLFGGG